MQYVIPVTVRYSRTAWLFSMPPRWQKPAQERPELKTGIRTWAESIGCILGLLINSGVLT